MQYLFQSTSRLISHRNEWSFRVYMILLRDFAPEWNSRPGAKTRVNSHQGYLCQHDILWWYHVNKYRAMRGNWSELAPGRKLPQCHVNTPLHVFLMYCNWLFLQVPSSQKKRKNQTVRVLLGAFCLVVLFLLWYIICASIPTEETEFFSSCCGFL